MPLRTIAEVRTALQSRRLSAGSLGRIWRRRVPAPHAAEDDVEGKPTAAADEAPWDFLAEGELARAFVRQALDIGAFPLAADAAREGLRHHKADGELARGLAAALIRLGAVAEARHILLELPGQNHAGPKEQALTLRTLADCAYEEALVASSDELRRDDLIAALDALSRAASLAPRDPRCVTKASGVACLLAMGDLRGDNEPAAGAIALARRGLELLDAATTPLGVDLLVERARAYSVLGQPDAARAAWRRAVAHGDASPYVLARARDDARLIAEATGNPPSTFDECFPPLRLVVFSGHLVDLPHAATRRFPEELVPEAQRYIARTLRALEPCAGFSSAAAGADLLFVGELAAYAKEAPHGAASHIVLPWATPAFRASSVEPFGHAWVRRFERALETADTVRALGEMQLPGDSAGFEYGNAVIGGLARLLANSQGLEIVPVVLWNLEPGKPGGTGSFVEFWQSQGIEPINVLTSAKATAHFRTHTPRSHSKAPPGLSSFPPAERLSSVPFRSTRSRALGRETKTMLFADVVGYSKLTEAVIPAYVEHFLGLASRLVAESRHAPISVNTWGDAIYFVFDRAESGGLFALDLRDRIKATSWTELGVYWEDRRWDPPRRVPLSLRTALHTGPVYVHHDPVVRRLGFTGSHVSRAARIEPITPHAEIYASEEFAAIAMTEGAVDFACHFVGTTPLAKGYPGDFRLYQVRRTQAFPLELLARAVHQAYARKRFDAGESIDTNSSLAPWDLLPFDLKQENRTQAASIKSKLRWLGYELVPLSEGAPLVLNDAQVDALAEAEHRRWCESRRRLGWKHGARRNDQRKLHPSLVAWAALTPGERQKDIEAVREIPNLLMLARYGVKRS
jgi:class 3 adenylate cyclase